MNDHGFVVRMIAFVSTLLALTVWGLTGTANQDETAPDESILKTDQGTKSPENGDLTKPLEVVIATPKRNYRQLEPVVVRYEAKNTDPQKKKVRILLYHYHNVRVNVFGRGLLGGRSERTPNTLFAETKLYLPSGGSGGSAGGILAPSEVMRGRLVANLVNDMTIPGEYPILVEIDFRYRDDEGKWHAAVARSNVVKVNVVKGPFLSDIEE